MVRPVDLRKKLLAFVDNSLGRDTEILLPITFVFEKYLNVEVKFKFIWDLLYIKRWQPDIILLPNIRGHNLYVEIANFSRKSGIVVLALDSEGNFNPNNAQHYWGYNYQQKSIQEWVTCWSQKAFEYAKKFHEKEDQKKIVITGATGFDRYIFMPKSSKSKTLTQLKATHYQMAIGYAGWAFGKLYNSQRNHSFKNFFPENRMKGLEWLEGQRLKVRDMLKSAIEAHPDVLFVLKKHPKEDFEDQPIEGLNEMNELSHYSNVRYVKNEISIEELINVSDIWTGFETTTLFEAWLYNKPTIILNNDTNFPRTEHYKGSLIAKNIEEFQAMITKQKETKDLEQLLEKKILRKRKTLVESAIGFQDGCNHLRAMYFFQKSIINIKDSKNISLNMRHLRLYLLMEIGRFFYKKRLFIQLPGFRKSIYVFENRALPGLEQRKEKVYTALDKFHHKKGLHHFLNENKWESLWSVLNKN